MSSDSETITADESYDYEATDVIDNVFADTDETPTPAPAQPPVQKRVGRINIHSNFDINTIEFDQDYNVNTNLWDFIHRPEVKKELMCRGYTFYSENPDYYSFFAGYPYKPAKEINYSVLQPILDHIHDQVCAGNSEVNNWFLSWYAFILQKPTGMTCTVPMLMGDQGCGKTTFCTDLMVKAIGREYSTTDTNAAHYFGQFNGKIEFKKLGILNELADSDSSTNKMDNDRFKAIVTDTPIDITNKYEQTRNVQNVFSLIIVSNHARPITIEKNDRRIQPIYCKNDYANNINDDIETKRKKAEYFDQLIRCIEHKDFFPSWMAFFMNRGISGFSPRMLPDESDKKAYVEVSMRPHEVFFSENILKFVDDGWDISPMYTAYGEWCKSHGYSKPMTSATLLAEYTRANSSYGLKKDRRGSGRSGKRPYYLHFTDEGMKLNAKAIDEARALERESDEEDDEDGTVEELVEAAANTV